MFLSVPIEISEFVPWLGTVTVLSPFFHFSWLPVWSTFLNPSFLSRSCTSFTRFPVGFLPFFLSLFFSFLSFFLSFFLAYKTATHQTVTLVLDTIRLAMKNEKEKIAAELLLHSDQSLKYTSHAYFKLTQEYGITPSMSRRGNPYDNALAENFFGILKSECIYRHKPRTLAEADELIARYIYFYNRERIQLKTGVAPLTLHHFA